MIALLAAAGFAYYFFFRNAPSGAANGLKAVNGGGGASYVPVPATTRTATTPANNLTQQGISAASSLASSLLSSLFGKSSSGSSSGSGFGGSALTGNKAPTSNRGGSVSVSSSSFPDAALADPNAPGTYTDLEAMLADPNAPGTYTDSEVDLAGDSSFDLRNSNDFGNELQTVDSFDYASLDG